MFFIFKIYKIYRYERKYIFFKPLNKSDNFVGVIYMQTNFSIKQIKKGVPD